MDFFEALTHRWRSAMAYGDEDSMKRVWDSVSLAFGEDVAFLTYKAAKLLLKEN